MADVDEQRPLVFRTPTEYEERRLATPSVFDLPEPMNAIYYDRIKNFFSSTPKLDPRRFTITIAPTSARGWKEIVNNFSGRRDL